MYLIARFSHNHATYHCSECGKLTRDTGRGEGEVEMCAECFERAQEENLISDSGKDDYNGNSRAIKK